VGTVLVAHSKDFPPLEFSLLSGIGVGWLPGVPACFLTLDTTVTSIRPGHFASLYSYRLELPRNQPSPLYLPHNCILASEGLPRFVNDVNAQTCLGFLDSFSTVSQRSPATPFFFLAPPLGPSQTAISGVWREVLALSFFPFGTLWLVFFFFTYHRCFFILRFAEYAGWAYIHIRPTFFVPPDRIFPFFLYPSSAFLPQIYLSFVD